MFCSQCEGCSICSVVSVVNAVVNRRMRPGYVTEVALIISLSLVQLLQKQKLIPGLSIHLVC